MNIKGTRIYITLQNLKDFNETVYVSVQTYMLLFFVFRFSLQIHTFKALGFKDMHVINAISETVLKNRLKRN